MQLDNGLKVRVAKKYFNRFGSTALCRLEAGDRLELRRYVFSAKFRHYGWLVTQLPVRVIAAMGGEPSGGPASQEPWAPKGWQESNEMFSKRRKYTGRITQIRKMYRTKFLYMMVRLSDGRLTCVSRQAFVGSNLHPRDFKVGDEVVIRKVGFLQSVALNDWVIRDHFPSTPISHSTPVPM